MSTINLKYKNPEKSCLRKNYKSKKRRAVSIAKEDFITVYAKDIILIEPDEDLQTTQLHNTFECVQMDGHTLIEVMSIKH